MAGKEQKHVGTKGVIFAFVSLAIVVPLSTFVVSEINRGSVDSQSLSQIEISGCEGLTFPSFEAPMASRANLSFPLPEEAFDLESAGPHLLGSLSTKMDLYRANTSIFVPSDSLRNLNDILEVGDAYTLDQESQAPILVVEFTICGHERKAYALGQGNNSESAVLVIPGTGENQSSGIYAGSDENYHCCLFPLLDNHDAYVQLLPNQDQRAWHNGLGSKISWDYILRWQINNGGSYSASYIAETIALKKYLGSQNKSVALVGLSQGGNAALIAASISAPDALVVSSGYSVAQLATEFADEMQITLPGISRLLVPENLDSLIVFPTLFSYGLLETGAYKWEATSRETCEFFEVNPMVQCIVHEGGHVFPEQSVVNFLNSHLSVRAP